MTDNEIIKAFELCLKCEDFTGCRECPAINNGHNTIPKCRLALFNSVLDLITRQQAEIERLQNILICFMDALGKVRKVDDIDGISLIPLMSELNKQYRAELKAEAYKECLENVKNYIKTHCNPYGKPDFDYDTSIKILNFIDNLIKEMVSDDNA